MKKTWLLTVLFVTPVFMQQQARAQERGREQERGQQHEREVVRQSPQHFQAHPPGMHPHGPMVRQHQVRSLAPKVVVRGHSAWRHWEHPNFARPIYYWNWALVHSVTCVAEDSYGDQYPVTEATPPGFGLREMTAVEDSALDRCYNESGQDPSCYLVTCSHY